MYLSNISLSIAKNEDEDQDGNENKIEDGDICNSYELFNFVLFYGNEEMKDNNEEEDKYEQKYEDEDDVEDRRDDDDVWTAATVEASRCQEGAQPGDLLLLISY